MSPNKTNDETFDLWLSDNLKRKRVPNPDFTQNVVRKMQRLAAQRMLQRALLQKRIAAGLLILSVASVIGLLCCPPVLRLVYALMESAFTGLIASFINPQAVIWPVLAAGLFVLSLLLASLWKNLRSDY